MGIEKLTPSSQGQEVQAPGIETSKKDVQISSKPWNGHFFKKMAGNIKEGLKNILNKMGVGIKETPKQDKAYTITEAKVDTRITQQSMNSLINSKPRTSLLFDMEDSESDASLIENPEVKTKRPSSQPPNKPLPTPPQSWGQRGMEVDDSEDPSEIPPDVEAPPRPSRPKEDIEMHSPEEGFILEFEELRKEEKPDSAQAARNNAETRVKQARSSTKNERSDPERGLGTLIDIRGKWIGSLLEVVKRLPESGNLSITKKNSGQDNEEIIISTSSKKTIQSKKEAAEKAKILIDQIRKDFKTIFDNGPKKLRERPVGTDSKELSNSLDYDRYDTFVNLILKLEKHNWFKKILNSNEDRKTEFDALKKMIMNKYDPITKDLLQ